MAIDQYREQIGTPSGGIETRVNPIVAPQPEINLQGISQGIANLARAKEESNLNNARAELAALEPQAQLDFQTEYRRVEAGWTPDQAPIAVQMRDFIKNYTADVEKGLSNPRAAELVRARSNELATGYMLKGAESQLGIERDIRVGQYQKAYTDNALLGANDPQSVGLNLAKLNAMVMEDGQIPLNQRSEIVRKGSTEVALSTARVQAESNPTATLAVTGSLLGFKEPQLEVAGNIVDAIVARESGNRLYDKAGKILRGPAITQRDGTTTYAYGKYQMLESTAKQQAQAMGVPWNPDVFFREQTGNAQLDKETSDYHDLLGRGHIAANLERFGDPVVAAAAHNMGPAAAEAWAEGRPYQTQSGKWWRPKQPKDLSAMPEETRKYISGLGEVKEVAVNTADEYSTAFRLLDADQLLSVYGSAQSRLAEQNRVAREQQQIDKGFFQQRLQDITTAANAGTDFAMPTDDEFALLGPVQGALEKIRLLGLKSMAGQLNAQRGMSNSALQAQALMPDPEGVDNRENAQAQVNALRSNAKQILAQRDSDPGLAASQSPQAKVAIARWKAASDDFFGAGTQATPEQLDALNQAQGEYITTNFTIQKQWGVLNPQLPKDLADQMGEGFLRMMQDGNVIQATRRMQMLPRQVGGSPDAIEQVAKQTGDVGRFAMEGVHPSTLNTLFSARKLKPDDLNKQLGGATPKDVQQAVTNAFAPLLTSLTAVGPGGVGDSGTAARYLNNGVLLAKTYIASGKAASAKEAAGLAYADLYANRETVTRKGLRVPNDYNADAVENGLVRLTSTLTPSDLQVPAQVGFTPEEAGERLLRTVRTAGQWVTDETGEGAYLMVGGRPVLDYAGTPVRRTYKQATSLPVQAQIEAPFVPSIQGLR